MILANNIGGEETKRKDKGENPPPKKNTCNKKEKHRITDNRGVNKQGPSTLPVAGKSLQSLGFTPIYMMGRTSSGI
jgi:hypothetical protein